MEFDQVIDKNKVLIIQHSASIGGSGTSLRHIINSLIALHYDVELLLPAYSDDLANWLSDFGCTTYRMDVPILEFYNGGINSVVSPYAFLDYVRIHQSTNYVRTIIRESKAAIVIANSMTLCWLGKLIRQEHRRSICFHRETYQKSFFCIRKNIVAYRLKNYFDDVVFISKFDSDETGTISGCKHIIYDRVDIEQYNMMDKADAKKSLGLSMQDKYILFLGGISQLKGTHIAIEAMRFIKDPSVKLILVGVNERLQHIRVFSLGWRGLIRALLSGGVYSNRVEKCIRMYDLTDRLIYRRSTTDLGPYYSACELVIAPNTLAHQSRMIYEAGFAKIPIVIPNFPNTKEFLLDDVNGYEFECNSPAKLAEKIKLAISNDNTNIIQKNYYQCIERNNYQTLTADIASLMGKE